jgi:hypothetical protein
MEKIFNTLLLNMSIEENKSTLKTVSKLKKSDKVFKPPTKAAPVSQSTFERPTPPIGKPYTDANRGYIYQGPPTTQTTGGPPLGLLPSGPPPIGRPGQFLPPPTLGGPPNGMQSYAPASSEGSSLSQSTLTKPSSKLSLGARKFNMQKTARVFKPASATAAPVSAPVTTPVTAPVAQVKLEESKAPATEAEAKPKLSLRSGGYKPGLTQVSKEFVPKSLSKTADPSDKAPGGLKVNKEVQEVRKFRHLFICGHHSFMVFHLNYQI